MGGPHGTPAPGLDIGLSFGAGSMLRPPSPPSCRLDADGLSGGELQRDLVGDGLRRAVGGDSPVGTRLARRAPEQPPRRADTALGDEAHAHRFEEADLLHDAVTTAVPSGTARRPPPPVTGR